MFPMAKQIGDLLDGPSLLNQPCGKAVAKEMRASVLNPDSGTLQSEADNARDVAAMAEGTHGRNARKKYPAVRGQRPRMKHVLGER